MINTANAYAVDSGLLDQVQKINQTQVYYSIERLKKLLGDDLENRKVAFLGLSFKPGTSDVRMSPSLRLIEKLLGLGMKIWAYDPSAIEEAKKVLDHQNLRYCDQMEEVFEQAEVIILGTEWKDFVQYDYSVAVGQMSGCLFFDCRGVMDRERLENMGLKLEVL